MISHKHKAVFVHIPKCGGQSIERVFVEDNNLTWESRAPLLLRENNNELIGPPRLAHLGYEEYAKCGYASEEIMSEYRTFTVVRNPYKRLESLYRYLGHNCSVNFEKFVDIIKNEVSANGSLYWFVKPQSDYICDESGNVLVDEVFHLESLSQSMPAFLKKFGISINEIPHTNKSKPKNFLRQNYTRFTYALAGQFSWSWAVDSMVIWNDYTIRTVDEIYKNDFETLGYRTMEVKK
jgi:hypothetical protein